MSAALLSTSFAIVQAAPPPLLPDLKPKEVHLEQTGELTITVVNGGTADAPALVDSYVTVFVDGERQVDIDLPLLPYTDPANTIELSTGVFVNGLDRRLLIFVDSGEVHVEENEYQNVMSMAIDVTWRTGADLSVDAEFDQFGDLTINVTNVGDQPSDPMASVLFDVDIAGTVTQFSSADLNTAIQPGVTVAVTPPTPITAPEFDDVTITMPFDPATDLDSTNNFVTRRHVNMASINPDVPGTDYYNMLTNNPLIRNAIKFYPLCGHASCSCPNDDCDGIAYDNWSGEWAFLKDGGPDVPGLTATILLLEQHRPLPFLDDRPEAAAAMPGSSGSSYFISENNGAVVYLNRLALTLWFDVRKNSLHNISDPNWNLAYMASLLAPEDLEWQLPLSNFYIPNRSTLNGTPYFVYDVRTNLAAPTVLYDFMSALNNIGPTMDDTAWTIFDWTRNYGIHDAILKYGTDDDSSGYHEFYPKVSYPRYWTHPIGGCGRATGFMARVLRPLGIPLAQKASNLHYPSSDCGVPHNRFALPFVSKPDAAPGDVGVYIHHTDYLNISGKDYGYTLAPSHASFFTTNEAFCKVGLDYDSCPCECESDCVSCSLDPVCDEAQPECICDPLDPSCDPTQQTIPFHPCAMQATYNMVRHDVLRGKEYLTGRWLHDYYECACINDPLCEHYEPTSWPECYQDPEYIVKSNLETPFLAPLLDQAEETEFLNALAGLQAQFGWDITTIWDDLARRRSNVFNVPFFTIDCNNNGRDDLQDIFWYETSDDCDDNGIPDECQDTSTDCNTNGIWDACDIDTGTSADCNGNQVPDECDVETGSSTDCNSDGVPDECEPDCNGNGTADECDIDAGTSEDCDGTGVPDECETDCNGNGFEDSCDLASGTSEDCNANTVPDECDIAGGTSTDDLPAGGDGIPDDCQNDCNGNGIPDAADLVAGTSWDCNQNDVPDECDMVGAFYESSGPLSPFNDPAVPPTHTFTNVPASGVDVVFTFDTFAFIGLTAYQVNVNLNGTYLGPLYDTPGYVSCADPPGQDQMIIPAATFNALTSGGNAQVTMTQTWATGETCGGAWISVSLGYGSFDCNDNEIADDCELDWGLSSDCNLNLMLDECDIANGTSQDTNGDGIPDECVVCAVDADCDDGNECTDDTCDSGICTNTNEPGGTTCDDGQFCTTGETCNAGVCGGGSATDCSGAGDQCNTGVCNETTDACEAQPANEGLACDDGLFCTTGETCTTGVCGGGSATDCSGS
ncbi:MAG: hypothetical protein IH987_16190, partial [Planctomycetes bacterium]|nr:hypothetical protein [Planctomycetota bacterium]